MQDAIRLLLLKESSTGSATTLENMLGRAGVAVDCVCWGTEMEAPAPECDVILIATDRWPSSIEAMICWCRRGGGEVPVLIAAPKEELGKETGIRGLEGTIDFIFCPTDEVELFLRIERLALGRREVSRVVEALEEEFAMLRMAGRHTKFLAVLEQVRRIARVNAPALICGETGTGKELCSRAIHYLGPRRSAPFIPVDCGCLPDHLFENEMFGHERGAYTDARSRQKGLVELAEGGTLLLDEVDSLSIANQGKLLRFLEERKYRPLGAETYRKADINILAAANRDLLECVSAKQFRQDLYYRLNILGLRIPPLRERMSDVPILANHFLDSLPERKRLSPEALRALSGHSWPGNVRELHNTIYRAAVFCEGETISAQDLGLAVNGRAEKQDTLSYREARLEALHSFELAYVKELLALSKGNVTQAAKRAGKERRAFGKLVQKHGLGGQEPGKARAKKAAG